MYIQPAGEPLLSHTPASQKTLKELDFFDLVKLSHLSEDEKQKRRVHMATIILLHFINSDLPHLLSSKDLTTLEQMTQNLETIDLQKVQDFLRAKIKNYDSLMEGKILNLKKQLILNHYQGELKMLELEQKYKGRDCLEQILTLKRIIHAIENDDWDTVVAAIPHTTTTTSH